MNRHTAITYAAPALLVPVAVPILFLILIGGQSSRPPDRCGAAPNPSPAAALGDQEVDAEQMSVATRVVAASRAFPPTANKPRAAVIALATARQESGIRNLDYGDRDSLGVFQQRSSQGWGTPDQVRDVAHATTSFLHHLILVPGWESRPVTDVAADVQRPAEEFRGLYQRWVPLAQRVTVKLWPDAAVQAGFTTAATCGPILLASAGSVVYPVPTGFVGTDQHNWGGTGSHWRTWHTGTDFSVPCGTAVLAATGGTVEIDTSQSWAGRWLVRIVTGPTSLATWYAHMRNLDVVPGQRVVAGQRIGDAGALGNATGCHLHFEVHLHNGSIYAPDNVDPSPWLAAHARAR